MTKINISKCYRFLKSVLSFSMLQLDFQQKKMPRILLTITVNFGCSSYNFPEMNLDFRDLRRKHFYKGSKHDINGHRNHNSLGRGTIAASSRLWASVADIRDDPGQNQYTKRIKIKGPDNHTSQLLPRMSNKCGSGTGKEGKTKEVVEDREVKKIVCYKVVCGRVVCVC